MFSTHKHERLTCGKAREENGGAATAASREDLVKPKQQWGTERGGGSEPHLNKPLNPQLWYLNFLPYYSMDSE